MTDFKEGDKVRVVFEGVWHEWGGLPGVELGRPYGLYRDGALSVAKSIELIERAGRPLEVGEIVTYGGQYGSVMSVFKCCAWVLFGGGDIPVTCGLSLLFRPCGTPITEDKS